MVPGAPSIRNRCGPWIGSPPTRRSGPNGPRPGRAYAGGGVAGPAYQAIARALVVSREGRREAALGRRLEDGQGLAAGQRRRRHQAARAEGDRLRGLDERVVRDAQGGREGGQGPLEVDRGPAERDEPGVRASGGATAARPPAGRPRSARAAAPASGHEQQVRGGLADAREAGAFVHADRDGVVGEDPEVRPFAARGDGLGRRACGDELPRPRPRAHPAVPIDDR